MLKAKNKMNSGRSNRQIQLGWTIILLVQLLLLVSKVDCFTDSIFDYVSFDDPEEWAGTYKQTCQALRSDKYREPRVRNKYDFAQPSWESKSPVAFNSKDTKPAPSNLTLHIYNNPGIRGGYSVSYGFQRNKECIHGQDFNCVADRSFGSVRALVLNADRFKDKQNLNYIKDHFQIEEPEKFVTILNGGSIFERKFYEAVFLGGYPPRALQNRGRSSHRIDGKPYPLEIYMYFVDETVPSMSLATILVVMVEESDRDNPYIKPIVKTVQDKLYDDERRFIHNNNGLFRKERLFHHQGASIKYDLFQKEDKHKPNILMERSGQAKKLEGSMVSDYEIYEKMQSLEAQFYFLDEDLKQAKANSEIGHENTISLELRQDANKRLDLEFEEIHMALLISAKYGIPYERKERPDNADGWKDCKDRFSILNKFYEDEKSAGVFGQSKGIPRSDSSGVCGALLDLKGRAEREKIYPFFYMNVTSHRWFEDICTPHFLEYRALFEAICSNSMRFMNWEFRNKNMSFMQYITYKEKYQHIKEFQEIDKETKNLNQKMYNHFFGPNNYHSKIVETNLGTAEETIPTDFKDEKLKHKMMDSILSILLQIVKKKGYDSFINETTQAIQKLVEEHNFPDVQTMRDVIHYHKFGKKHEDPKTRRSYVHDAFFEKFLPYQQKRRSFVDFRNMEESEKEIDEENDRSPLKVKVDQAFQISWLIPPNGGYYYYAGSSPVPPCFRAQNVIVFKKPITMSRRQIEALTRIPVTFKKNQDINHTTPVLHDLTFKVNLGNKGVEESYRYAEVTVPVYNQKRNHLFLGHDSVHKNSVEEFEKRETIRKAREDAKKAGTSVGPTQISLFQMVSLATILRILM